MDIRLLGKQRIGLDRPTPRLHIHLLGILVEESAMRIAHAACRRVAHERENFRFHRCR